MEATCKLSNEETTSESKRDMPALQEMIHDIRESTASLAQTSNTTLPAEDLLITQAIYLPSCSENDALSEESGSSDDVNNSADKTSENLVGALISTGKRLSFALNNAASQEITESEEHFNNTIPVEPTPVQQIDNTQPCPAPTSIQAAIPINASKKKQHIMISYNRSCEDACRTIRNSLKKLKYKVWMDVFDMHDNFIDGMAKAIRNSYIVLICINRKYDSSYWCKQEIQDIAIKRIKFIPCFMEEPFDLVDWLDFLISGNVWIDFSKIDQFDESFEKLIKEISCIEEKLATYPRETPPATPTVNSSLIITSNPTVEESFDNIMRNFKTWVEENRHILKQSNRKQSSELIHQLIQALQSDDNTLEDKNKKELLQQLLAANLQEQSQLLSRLSYNLTTLDFPLINSLLFIMALWAVRVVFKKK